SHHRLSIDEKAGRSGDTAVARLQHVFLHTLRAFTAVKCPAECLHIEPQFGRTRFKRGTVQSFLLGEKRIVEFPEAPLRVGRHGGCSGQARAGMEGQRQVPENNPYCIPVVGSQLLHALSTSSAEWALEV